MNKFLLPLLALSFLFVVSTAEAQTNRPQCNFRGEVVKLLLNKYKEVPTANGITSTGGMIELFKSKGGDTWTIVLSVPNGPGGKTMSCLIAAGDAWRTFEPTEYPGGEDGQES